MKRIEGIQNKNNFVKLRKNNINKMVLQIIGGIKVVLVVDLVMTDIIFTKHDYSIINTYIKKWFNFIKYLAIKIIIMLQIINTIC